MPPLRSTTAFEFCEFVVIPIHYSSTNKTRFSGSSPQVYLQDWAQTTSRGKPGNQPFIANTFNKVNFILDFIYFIMHNFRVPGYPYGHLQSPLPRLQSTAERNPSGLPNVQTHSRWRVRSLPSRQAQPGRSNLRHRLHPPSRLAQKNGEYFRHQLSHRQKPSQRYRRSPR